MAQRRRYYRRIAIFKSRFKISTASRSVFK
jgi:hypothetical protein